MDKNKLLLLFSFTLLGLALMYQSNKETNLPDSSKIKQTITADKNIPTEKPSEIIKKPVEQINEESSKDTAKANTTISKEEKTKESDKEFIKQNGSLTINKEGVIIPAMKGIVANQNPEIRQEQTKPGAEPLLPKTNIQNENNQNPTGKLEQLTPGPGPIIPKMNGLAPK